MSFLGMSRKNRWASMAVDSDIVIPIMGPTGAGKSTFISVAAGSDVACVGHGLESCTAELQPIPIPYPKDPTRRVVFVDTPGFDDTYRSDAEILRCIADWLKESYKEKKQLSGIVYLHEISQKRMSGSSRKNYMMFEKLCGNDAAKNIVLATTKWDLVRQDIGERHEKQLVNEFWADLLREGSRTARFSGTHDSAWQIINSIIDHKPINIVLIQHELLVLMKFLPDTQAGHTLRLTLQELLGNQRKAVQELQERGQNDEQAKRRHAEIQDRLQMTIAQIEELNVPISMRVKRFFGLL